VERWGGGLGPNMKQPGVETTPITFDNICEIINQDDKINVIILCKKRVKMLANNKSFKVILTADNNPRISVERRVEGYNTLQELYDAFSNKYCTQNPNKSVKCSHHIYMDYCDFLKMSRNSVHKNAIKDSSLFNNKRRIREE